ncbi:unnamed protein product [Symbiodinium sp. KB8]|nr:unnamed protein product [Symbiodinium sp. KB8]
MLSRRGIAVTAFAVGHTECVSFWTQHLLGHLTPSFTPQLSMLLDARATKVVVEGDYPDINDVKKQAKEKAEREKRQLAKLRKEFRYQGRIDKAEHRGTTVSQLEKATAPGLRLLGGELLRMDRSPASKDVQDIRTAVWNPERRLRIDFLNFYHLSKYLLLPMTQPLCCTEYNLRVE